MPIINSAGARKKEKIKAEISSEIINVINDYCAWANIDDLGFFIEEAASFVFAKDRDWKRFKKAKKKQLEAAS